MSKIGVHFDKLSLLNRLSYRPGVGLEWKKIKKSSKSSQEKNSENLFFLISLKTNKDMQLFYSCRNQFWQSWAPLLYPNVISEQIKLGQPAWSHIEDLSQSFQMVIDFAMFFLLHECKTLTNIFCSVFFCAMVMGNFLLLRPSLWPSVCPSE